MPDAIPWMPFYAADWITSHSVRAMSLAERGLYITLISEAWLAGGSLPADLERLARIVGMTEKELRQALEGPLGEVWSTIEGRLVNDRLAEIYAEQAAKVERRRNAGRAGGRASADGRSSNAERLLNDCSTIAPATPPESSTEEEVEEDSEKEIPPQSPPRRGGGSKVAAWEKLLADGAAFHHLRDDPRWSALEVWLAHLRERLPRAHTTGGARQALKRIAEMTPERFEAAVRHSIEGNYQGLYEPRQNAQTTTARQSVWDLVESGQIEIQEPTR